MFDRLYPPGGDLEFSGHWTMELRGPDGHLKQKVEGANTICSAGKEFLASFLQSAVVAASTFTMRYIAVGTGNTAESSANTQLSVESARTTGTASYVSNQVYRVVATFAAGTATTAIVEYGLFSSSTGGTIFSRDTEAVINKGASDTLTVTADFTIS